MVPNKNNRPPRKFPPLPSSVAVVVWPSLEPLQIFPGQDLPLTWSITTLSVVALGTVRAKIFLHPWTQPLAESKDTKLIPRGTWSLSTGDQVLQVPAPGPGGLANDLNSIGTHVLRLEVTSTASGQSFFAETELTVVGDAAPSWIWNPPDGTPDDSAPSIPQIPLQPQRYNLLIHHDYMLSGTLILSSAPKRSSLSLEGKVTLLEKRPDEDASVEVESQVFQLVPGQQVPVVFTTKFNKNWTWLIPGIWIYNPVETRGKAWSYTIKITYSDDYNNVYGDREISLPMVINIGVDDTKNGFAGGALAALGVGAVLGIFTFGAAAGIAQAIAAGLGAKALDPPHADQRYARPVALPIAPTPTPASGAVQPVAILLAYFQHLLALIQASEDTLNRVLGAMEANDKSALKRQTAMISRIEEAVDEVLRSVSQQWGPFVTQLAAFDVDAIEATLRRWQTEGFPRELTRSMESAGVSDTAISSLANSIGHDEVSSAASDLAAAMAGILQCLVRGARHSIGRARVVAETRDKSRRLGSKQWSD